MPERECKCGCGEYTRGGTFRPGHDARYHSAQRKLNQHAAEIVAYFNHADKGYGGPDWLLRSASRFCDYRGGDQLEAARLLSVYYTDRPGHRAKDDWTITTDPAVMLRTILRVSS